MIDGVVTEDLRVIRGKLGDVYHALKSTDPAFRGFGEAYFSTVRRGAVKGWKRHRRMTLNLVVPVGAIRFVLFDDRPGSPTRGEIAQFDLSPREYSRLTVPPGIWMAFQGRDDGKNLLLNVADIPHDPEESENADLADARFPAWNWSA